MIDLEVTFDTAFGIGQERGMHFEFYELILNYDELNWHISLKDTFDIQYI